MQEKRKSGRDSQVTAATSEVISTAGDARRSDRSCNISTVEAGRERHSLVVQQRQKNRQLYPGAFQQQQMQAEVSESGSATAG
ncbi:hypothetical protein TNCV_646261 [Trichonephila clavipes]|nr:hypothetical protein TNCV_646261 [Trichonephila clavipes]